MKKIDRRRSYILAVDVETAGGLGNPLTYDVGFAITDRHGNIYEERSFVIREIFQDKELMDSAYYAEKVPKYLEDIANGTRQVVSFMEMREEFLTLALEYEIKTITAYNLEFDRRALGNTIRYITENEKAQFLIKELAEVEMMCIWCLACEVLYTQKRFAKEAVENNWLTPAGNYRTSAEIGYRYITGDVGFIEEHTGLEDVRIEIEIMALAFRQNKKRIGGMFAHPWRIPNGK